MTRKNYIAIAEAINVSLFTIDCDDMPMSEAHNLGITVAARNIADVMQADNPRFDRDRFLKACGVA